MTHKQTLRLGVLFTTALFAALAPLGALAATSSDIIARSDGEIQQRINDLTALSSRLSSAKHVSASTAASLQTTIQTNITGLQALKQKIDGETDVATLQADEASIFTSFRIYALVIPQGYILVSGDAELTIAANLSTIAAQLQTQIAAAQAAGNDVSSLQPLLSDMNVKIAGAQIQAQAAMNGVSGLVPDQGNSAILQSNNAALATATGQILTGQQDLLAAAGPDARVIVAGLSSFPAAASGGTTNTSTGSGNSSPDTPTGLAVSCNADGTQATVSWNASSGDTEYFLRIDNPANNPCPPMYGNSADTWYCPNTDDVRTDSPPLTTTTYTTTVVPGRAYNWWVLAGNDTGQASGTASGPGLMCSAPTTTTNSLTPTPASGPAPLTVTFTGTVVPGFNYSLAYGDYTPPSPPIGCSSSTPSCSFTLTHTYAYPGGYLASVNQNNAGTAVATAAAHVTVSGGSSSDGSVTISASPAAVAFGQRSTVSWNSPASGSCVLTSPQPYNSPSDLAQGVPTSATGHSGVGPLTRDAMYIITCGGVSASVSIPVAHTSISVGTPTGLTSACNGNGTATLSWTKAPGDTSMLLRVNDPNNDSASCQDGWYCANTDDVRTDSNPVTGTSYTASVSPGVTYQWWIVPQGIHATTLGQVGFLGQTVGGADFSCSQ